MTLITNGVESKVEMDVAPMLRDGRTCLPVRFVAEAFGLGVEWRTEVPEDNGYGIVYRDKVVITEGIKTLILTIGDTELLMKGFNFADPIVEVLNIATPKKVENEQGNNISLIVTNGVYYINGDNGIIYKGSIDSPEERIAICQIPISALNVWGWHPVFFYTRNDHLYFNYISRIGGYLRISGTVRIYEDGSWEEIEPYWEDFGSLSVMIVESIGTPANHNLFIQYNGNAPVPIGDTRYAYGKYWDWGAYNSGGSESRSLYMIDDDIYLLARDKRTEFSAATGENPYATGIYKVNIKTNATTRVVDANVSNFLIEGELIYYVDLADFCIYSVPLTGGEPTRLTGALDVASNSRVYDYIQVLNGTVYYVKRILSGIGSEYQLFRTGDDEPINPGGYARDIQTHDGYICAFFDSEDGSDYRMIVFNAAGDVVFRTSDEVFKSSVTVDNERLYFVDTELRQVKRVRLSSN
jgi:hypothetical protein